MNSFITITNPIFQTLLILIIVNQVLCYGDMEVVITSPETVLISHSVCPNERCNGISLDARRIKLNANVPFRFDTAEYEGQGPRYYDFNLKVLDLNGEEIARVSHTQDSDTTWKSDSITTSEGFNITYKYQTRCDSHYFGARCHIFCQKSNERHTECTSTGERRCMQGWTGLDCSTPICSKSCNERGTCLSPGQCKCKNGYTGTECEQCIPQKGCVHGGCAHNVSFTCACLPGYGGELCNHDLEICQRQKPCLNGGICSNGGPKSFTCNCPPGYGGERCEVPIKQAMCGNLESGGKICMNGGICFPSSANFFECRCQPGFSGHFCEKRETFDLCGGCKNGGNCSLNIIRKPVCQCATCYKGINCEILDADCILSRVDASINQSKEKTTLQIDKTDSSADGTELSTRYIFSMIFALVLLIVILSILFFYITRNKKTSLSNESMMSTFPSTPRKQSKLVYQACVIDAEQLSDSEIDSSCSRRDNNPSPPPAYYPPFPKYASAADHKSKPIEYRTTPTNESPHFHVSSLEATIV